MSITVTVSFDPSKDAAADVQATVLRVYAKTNGAQLADAAAAAPAPADGEDEGGAAADPSTLDANGVPHDASIHSATPTMTAKGVWRKRKGISDVNFAEGLAALKAKTITPAGATIPAALPGLALPVQPTDEYTKLVKLVADNMQTPANPAGRINEPWVQQTLVAFGVANGMINALQTADPALTKQIRTAIATALGVSAE